MSIKDKLMQIQVELKAPKNLYNSFGKYKYRNAEGICEAVKPFLKEQNVSLVLSDDIIAVADRIYVKSNATLMDNETDEQITVSAMARESSEKKGMDDSQITGTASSYARKYALNGLFLLDDTKDADSDEYKQENDAKQEKKQKEKEFEQVGDMTISKIKVDTLKKRCEQDNVPLEYILKSFNLEKLEDMTEKQFSQTVNNWKVVCEKAR